MSADHSSGLVVLPLHCANCGQPLKLAYDPLPAGEPLQIEPWPCPHGCGHVHIARLPGSIVWIEPQRASRT
jgi:hypothetical protein